MPLEAPGLCRCGDPRCTALGLHAWAYHIGNGPRSDHCETCLAALEVASNSGRDLVDPGSWSEDARERLCPVGAVVWHAVNVESEKLKKAFDEHERRMGAKAVDA